MKFKTKKEFEDSLEWGGLSSNNWNNGYKEAVDDVFESIAECAEFYKKYRYHVAMLEKEQPEIYKIYSVYMKEKTKSYGWRDTCDAYVDDYVYNNWLFDYCFQQSEMNK